MEWMHRNKYLLGVDGARASLQKKEAVSIGKKVAGAIGLFTKLPLSVTSVSFLSSLPGAEEGFRQALEGLEPLCDVLGVRPLDGRILAIIDADELAPNEILESWQEIDSRSVAFHDLLPMTSSTNRMACFVYLIQVYSARESFDRAMRELYPQGWWRAGWLPVSTNNS